MPPNLALIVFSGYVIWAIRKEGRLGDYTSPAVWLPVLWFGVVASRPVSYWFGSDFGGTSVEEGSPLDRAVFLALILVGSAVLVKRRVRIGAFLIDYPLLAVFYGYCLVSLLWSDFPAVAFKRLVKEAGSLVMILVLLSDRFPRQAIARLFFRLFTILVPFSVLLVKYYPDLGRSYNRWTWQVSISGVSSGKNGLGCICFLAIMYFCWAWRSGATWTRVPERSRPSLIFALNSLFASWLLMKADSATSLVCAIVGSLLFFGLTSKTGIQHFKTIEIAVLIAFPLVAFVEIFFGFSELFVKALGRDMSLTTRTDLWPLLLSIHNAPVLGVGYESFWIGERLDQVWEVYKGLNQAHNGYLELFLNTGLVGVGLFGAFLVSSLLSMRFRLLRGKDSFVALSLAGCLMIIVYNFTEASFARLSLPWLCFLVFMSIRGEDGAHRGDAD